MVPVYPDRSLCRQGLGSLDVSTLVSPLQEFLQEEEPTPVLLETPAVVPTVLPAPGTEIQAAPGPGLTAESETSGTGQAAEAGAESVIEPAANDGPGKAAEGTAETEDGRQAESPVPQTAAAAAEWTGAGSETETSPAAVSDPPPESADPPRSGTDASLLHQALEEEEDPGLVMTAPPRQELS